MSELADHVADYLKLRRRLGYKLRTAGQLLPQFVAYLEAAGASVITTELAVDWARHRHDVDPVGWSQRLTVVRGFARYLKTIDPCTEVPPAGVFPFKPKRRNPYLYSSEDVDRLLEAAGRLRPPLRAATLQTLFGLLSVTGMRIGEALRLRRDEVDLDQGVLTITGPKSGHPRLVPLHPTTIEALRSYAQQRDRWCPQPTASTFFISRKGTAVQYRNVSWTFANLTTAIGLRTDVSKPRIHDLRHSFAVCWLLDWYRSGADVAARMVTLSTYLGHVVPDDTYWYVSSTPELMSLAAQRLDQRGGPS